MMFTVWQCSTHTSQEEHKGVCFPISRSIITSTNWKVQFQTTTGWLHECAGQRIAQVFVNPDEWCERKEKLLFSLPSTYLQQKLLLFFLINAFGKVATVALASQRDPGEPVSRKFWSALWLLGRNLSLSSRLSSLWPWFYHWVLYASRLFCIRENYSLGRELSCNFPHLEESWAETPQGGWRLNPKFCFSRSCLLSGFIEDIMQSRN